MGKQSSLAQNWLDLAGNVSADTTFQVSGMQSKPVLRGTTATYK